MTVLSASARHWAAAWIGRPYHELGGLSFEAVRAALASLGRPHDDSSVQAAAAPPGHYNCFTMFRAVQIDIFGRALPEIGVSGDDLLGLARAFARHAERHRWHRVDRPREGDGVLLAKGAGPIHVGVWIDADRGKVLHCPRPGVMAQALTELRLAGWKSLGFYHHQGTGPA